MADIATLRARLAEAEQALHVYLTTGGTTQLRHGDKWWTNGKMSEAGLRAYIAELKSQLGVGGGRIRARAVIF